MVVDAETAPTVRGFGKLRIVTNWARAVNGALQAER
jgi:hypothetical protein